MSKATVVCWKGFDKDGLVVSSCSVTPFGIKGFTTDNVGGLGYPSMRSYGTTDYTVRDWKLRAKGYGAVRFQKAIINK